MNIKMSNSEIYKINLVDNNMVVDKIKKIYKHLKHLTPRFGYLSSPHFLVETKSEEIVRLLIEAGNLVGIRVDTQRLTNDAFQYTNDLHKFYEKNYDGDPNWLTFHELIHLYEIKQKKRSPTKMVMLDFQEQTGILHPRFDPDWSKYMVTNICKGDVVVQWAELGKGPYTYWADREPDNINRLCELSKPWLELKCQYWIAIEDIDFLQDINTKEFQDWWQKHLDRWCSHWNIPQWGLEQIFGRIVIGRMNNIDQFLKCISDGIIPVSMV